MGYPLVNVHVQMLDYQLDGSETIDNATAMKVCGEKAIREFCAGQSIALLEPSMSVEFRVESDAFGSVVADVSSVRRGEVLDVSVEGREKVAQAIVPLKEMIGYRFVVVVVVCC
jgi:translation elongation factor EF-G